MVRSLAIAALAIALAYIVYLRRELALARSRGDRYRDLAAQLDRHQTH